MSKDKNPPEENEANNKQQGYSGIPVDKFRLPKVFKEEELQQGAEEPQSINDFFNRINEVDAKFHSSQNVEQSDEDTNDDATETESTHHQVETENTHVEPSRAPYIMVDDSDKDELSHELETEELPLHEELEAEHAQSDEHLVDPVSEIEDTQYVNYDDLTEDYADFESDPSDSDYDDYNSQDEDATLAFPAIDVNEAQNDGEHDDTENNSEDRNETSTETSSEDDNSFLPITVTEEKKPLTRREIRELERQQESQNIFSVPESDSEDSQDPKQSKGKKIGIIAGALAGAAAIGAGAWALFHFEPWAPDTVATPAAVNMIERGTEFSTACEPFESIDLNCTVELEATDEAPRGQLISQSIERGEEVEYGTSIALTYANGPEQAEFPNLRNNTVEEAEQTLYDMNIVVSEIEEIDNSGLEPGRVVSSSIEAGETVHNGDEIVLQISSGTVNIPDWTGETRELVSAEAESLGLEVEFLEEESDEASGTVIEQNPPAGEENTSKVQVTLAKAFEEEMIEIPDVDGLAADEARSQLATAGFRQISTVLVESSEISDGHVLRVLPDKGEEAGSEDDIYILVVDNG